MWFKDDPYQKEQEYLGKIRKLIDVRERELRYPEGSGHNTYERWPITVAVILAPILNNHVIQLIAKKEAHDSTNSETPETNQKQPAQKVDKVAKRVPKKSSR